MIDYRRQSIKVGDCIRNIESGWHGRIIGVEGEGVDLLLVCQGINWWTGEIDEDDKQWHSPFDVVKVSRAPDRSKSPNNLNFL